MNKINNNLLVVFMLIVLVIGLYIGFVVDLPSALDPRNRTWYNESEEVTDTLINVNCSERNLSKYQEECMKQNG